MDMSDMAGHSANLFWSRMYAQLSEFFKEPSAGFTDDVASGRLARFFEEQLRTLALDLAPCKGLAPDGNVATRLSHEYGVLFRGPIPPYVVPVESVYKRWASDPGCHLPMAQEKGFLMGDSAVDMMRRYQNAGITIPDEFLSMPDHIALELEYMSALSLYGDETACSEFLSRHLDWLDDLTDEIKTVGNVEFYASGARIARDIIDRARRGGMALSAV